MIVSSLFFCITTICFLREFKLGKNEGYIQRFYYYVGGYGGGLFFLYMFLSGMYGEVSHISVKFVTFLLFIFLGNSRMDFFYKQKYYVLKKYKLKNLRNWGIFYVDGRQTAKIHLYMVSIYWSASLRISSV